MSISPGALAERIDSGARQAEAQSGWIDRLLGLPRRLPGAAPVWWIALFLVMTLVPAGILWLAGIRSPGDVDSRIWVAALLAAYGIGFIHVLDDVARQAFAIFEPAVRNRGDVGVLSRALTLVPDRIALPFVLVFEVVVTIAYLSDPVERAHLLSRQFLEQAAIMVTNWASGVITAVLLLHVVRQLVAVTRLHRLADVDLFDAGPAHAFARLTATAATGILVLALVVVADPAAASNTILFAVQVGGIILLAVAAFGLPLRGMHGKLVAEQAALLRSVNERIKLVISRIHTSVDADELERSGHLQETLTSLIAERELIGKLSTWPWSTGTFRGFASALLLPIAIWAITRALEQVI